MASELHFKQFPASDTKELSERFKQLQLSYKENYGNNPYAGHLGLKNGLTVITKKFPDSKSAIEYLENHNTKYGPAFALRVGDFSKTFPSTKTEINASKKLRTLIDERNNWKPSLIKRVKASKSKLKGCSKCLSKINTQYINDIFCPICFDSNFITTKTDKANIERIQSRITTQETLITNMRAKHEKNPNLAFWLVGGWVST